MTTVCAEQLVLEDAVASHHQVCHCHLAAGGRFHLPKGEPKKCDVAGCNNTVHNGLRFCLDCAVELGRCQICNAGITH